MKHSETIAQLATALAKAQKKVEGAAKDSTNPHFKSKYADLASVKEACLKALNEHGLSVVQFPSAKGNVTSLETVLLHESGEWIAPDEPLTAEGRDAGPQSVGSAITYLRRYALAALAGVAPEDDDGEAATPRYGPGARVDMPPPVPIQPSPAKLAAEMNAGIAAGAALKPASSLRAPVRGKPQSRYVPPLPANGEIMPPITDDDVPF
jgi:ERF superfamily protein